MSVVAITTRNLSATLQALALGMTPPAFTRLEPQSISGDPTPGLEARVHDPLWLLARQWQLGEFHGEDAGTPVAVHVQTGAARVGAWQPGDPTANKPARSFDAASGLDPVVEREPTTTPLGLRQRAEAGAQLLDDLDDAGITGVRDALIAVCPLAAAEAGDPFDLQAPRLSALVAGRLPDGDLAARDLEAAGGGAPAWLARANDADAALAAAKAWNTWYRQAIAPLPDPDTDSWIDERLEYRFSVRLDRAADQVVLRAPAFAGGRVDWFAFDHDANPANRLPTPDAPAALVEDPREAVLIATPLRFAGMPSDRYWQFEDGQVNLGMLETQPHDLARLCLAEFAMVYGNDWLVVPVDVEAGVLTSVTSVSYTTTFGERLSVAPASDASRPSPFRMFQISNIGTPGVLDGLFVPPTMAAVQEGRALEDVLFLRDDAAAMAWAVERVVQGPSGDARSRGDEPRPAPVTERTEPGAELDYLLETTVPDHWIPIVPIAVGVGAMALRKGAMLKAGAPVMPRGVLLRPTPLTIRDEEIAREGVRVRRVPALARRADGSYERWIGRRVSVGRGEGQSGLGFDWAIPRNNGGQ